MKCSLPKCRAEACTQLRAVDGLFWFCRECAAYWLSRGYEDASA